MSNTIWGFPSTGQTVINTPTPSVNDYITTSSYGKFIYGLDAFASGSKWATIAAEVDPTDFIRLKLVGGQVNGVGISRFYQETVVNHTNLAYRDDGYGLFPSNYVDFVNGLFEQYGLYTRIYGTLNNPSPTGYFGAQGFIAKYCPLDRFTFVFVETGQVSPFTENTFPNYFYVLSGTGVGMCDTFGVLGTLASPVSAMTYNIYLRDFGTLQNFSTWFQLNQIL